MLVQLQLVSRLRWLEKECRSKVKLQYRENKVRHFLSHKGELQSYRNQCENAKET